MAANPASAGRQRGIEPGTSITTTHPSINWTQEKIQVHFFPLPDRLDLNNEFILIEFVLEKHTVSFIDFFCVAKTFAD